jgi:catechol 2,3-dioxygenase-like lactoylglutathione lyase family enzyme
MGATLMAVHFNHTIVHCRDKKAAAEYVGRILGVEPSPQWGPFIPLVLANDVNLDFADSDEVHPQHYAFLVEEDEFDAIFARIQEGGVRYYADPTARRPGEINHGYGGRGVYFDGPDGHYLEIITQPYS